MRMVPVGDQATVLVGIAAMVSAVGGGVISPILAFLARRHAKGAKEVAEQVEQKADRNAVLVSDVRDQLQRHYERVEERQDQGAQIGRELIDTMKDLRRRNG